jgi:hypothetical protein
LKLRIEEVPADGFPPCRKRSSIRKKSASRELLGRFLCEDKALKNNHAGENDGSGKQFLDDSRRVYWAS